MRRLFGLVVVVGLFGHYLMASPVSDKSQTNRASQVKVCSFTKDCPQGHECLHAKGTCQLPPSWTGPRSVQCSSKTECRMLVSRDSRCVIHTFGRCSRKSDLCSNDGECERGLACLDGKCEMNPDIIFQECSLNKSCPIGFSCCHDGRCSSTCDTCSTRNPNGLCPLGSICSRGRCSRAKCNENNDCPSGFLCQNQICVQKRQNTLANFDQSCTKTNRNGYCPEGSQCLNGECQFEELSKDPCSLSNPFGLCEPGSVCEAGECISAELCSSSNHDGNCNPGFSCFKGRCRPLFLDEMCSPTNFDGFCEPGFRCRNGHCVFQNECSADNWRGVCDNPNEVCRNGICVHKANQCSMENPRGFCPPGEICKRGKCVTMQRTETCSAFIPCPIGQMCDEGKCKVVCSSFFPDGFCPDDKVCHLGQCKSTGEFCSASNPSGICREENRVCHVGVCIKDDPENRCSRRNPTGRCPMPNQACLNGQCIEDKDNKLCTPMNPGGDCFNFLMTCVSGQCVFKCSRLNSNGFCPDGKKCISGQCKAVKETVACPSRPCRDGQMDVEGVSVTCHGFTGFRCPPRHRCNDGECTRIRK